jgi:glutathione S-transferase
MIRLWGFRYSTNADRVTIALAYKGIPYEAVPVDPADRSPVLALTAQPLVPVLEHDGRVLADSPAILEHLEGRFPDPPLYPADPAARAQAELLCEWFNRVWKIAPNALADGDADPAHAAALQRDQGRLDALLSDGRGYLLGDFSIADVTLWPFLRYAVDAEADDRDPFHQVLRDELSLDGRAHLAAWIERVGARSEAQHRFGLT